MESAFYLFKASDKKQRGFKANTPLRQVVLNAAFRNAVLEYLKTNRDTVKKPVARRMEIMPIINE